MNMHNLIKKSNILTLPKLAFSVFFLLLMAGSIMSAESIITAIINDWIDIIITVFVITYMLKSAFKNTTFQEKKPITTFMLLLFSFYIIYIDFKLLFSIIYLDFKSFHQTQLEVFVYSFFPMIILLFAYPIDGLMSKNSESHD